MKRILELTALELGRRIKKKEVMMYDRKRNGFSDEQTGTFKGR